MEQTSNVIYQTQFCPHILNHFNNTSLNSLYDYIDLPNKKADSSNDESALLTNKTVNCTAEIGIECYLSYNTYSTRSAQLGNCSFCVVQCFFAAAHNCLMSAAEYPKSKYAIGSFLSSCCHSLRRAILSSSA